VKDKKILRTEEKNTFHKTSATSWTNIIEGKFTEKELISTIEGRHCGQIIMKNTLQK